MKAVTVGSATVDVIATVDNDDIERMTLHNSTASFLLLEPGRKVDATSVITQTGGGAVNAAVGMARLGFDVAALVKLGRDHNAEKVVARLTEEGVDTALIRTCEAEATAVSVMIASHDRNAAIFTHRGANCSMRDEDVAAEAFAGADLVYVTNLSNQSADRFPDIVTRGKEAGAFVAVNPGIRQLTGKTESFFDSLPHTDLFTCNFEEARALVPALMERTGWEKRRGILDSDGPVMRIEGFHLPIEAWFRRVHDLGPRFLAITDGGKGAYLSDNGEMQFQAAAKAEVVGTAGAGDAFASTLAALLVEGLPVMEAAGLAARNAASVVSHVDTQTGLLSRDALKGTINW